LRRPAVDDARGRETDRQARSFHRIRPGRSALLLCGQYQEPAGKLFSDDRTEARRRPRRRVRSCTMKTFVGIDLGSTTTKAVLLDENCDVIGRGITNSRSNYSTAARVASEEARVDGRFTLFHRALGEAGGHDVRLDEFLGARGSAFRLEQFLGQ